ncbi:uncharacterized protein UV8b_01732 [Ustilaginoidea virens]|uniref:Uncharacterized protein n=1 Tax=Ustilaginoidea virens TaxID=1159556 RepID=A0A8E5MEP9_USTVR|nr:uncharacterized protein UV8b_01732 [Ustilaginoidea virens]QUC17491.1 hypothetical protein UV8b_01732 [Ustilaginoidea virens]
MGALTAITTAGQSIMAQALPAMMNASNPMAAMKSAAGALAQAGKNGALNAPGAPVMAKALLDPAIPDQTPTLQFPDQTPDTDPAYVAAPLLSPFMTSLQAYLTSGPNQGPDWSKFRDQAKKTDVATGSETTTEGLTWLLRNLRMQQSSAKLGKGEPSTELGAAFDASIAVVEEIKKEISKQQSLSSNKTDPAIIKKWQDEVTKAKLVVTKLETAAKSFPGASANTPKLQNIKMDIPKTENNAANYTKAVEAAAEVQNRLTGIQTKLKGLEIAGAALERVKEILIECIAILVELKVQISKLTTFFSALSTMVKVVIDTKVKNFKVDAAAIGDEAASRGKLTLNNLDIETIYMSTLQYINPGLDLLTELSKVTKTADEIAPKREALNKFTDEAHKAINKLGADKQREISDGLQSELAARRLN